MTLLPSSHLATAGVHLVPALVWGIMAEDAWRYLVTRRPTSRFFTLLPLFTSVMAFHYFLHAIEAVTPTELGGRVAGLHATIFALTGVASVMSMALLRHMVPLMPVRDEPPSRSWLAVHYGCAAVASAIVVLPVFWPTAAPRWCTGNAAAGAYSVVVGGLALRQLRRLARRGAWRPGAFALSSRDVIVITVTFAGAVAMMIGFLVAGGGPQLESVWSLSLHTGVALGLAVPFAVRMLGEMMRRLLLAAALLAGAGAALGAEAVASRLASAESRHLLELGALFFIVLALGPGQAWLRGAIDRFLFRRGRHQQVELQTFLHTLPAELGTAECCRRALAELTRVMQIPGAAVFLGGDLVVVHGRFLLETLAQVWPRDPAAVRVPPGAVFVDPRELPLPLREALVETEVAWVASITSPHRRWGHLLATEGFVRGRVGSDDVEAVGAFVSQLALVLDAADLLARALAVERSLAHREKLAAIGELAARIAHEIRNPVTAARSLAQQLARDPASPFPAEHGLILSELTRVERQVAALLRFARREEFRFEVVDLGQLVQATVESCRARLEGADVAVEVAVSDGVRARADAEKMRQVLLNLIENAIDALGETSGTRRLRLAVGVANGCATVQVADSGPGMPADAVPHLFEPFFSLKPSGTGLGLAIARRTVEAHGGRITASSRAGEGMTIDIELPVGDDRQEPAS